jgi:type I restriction enzyme S subunit
MSTEEPTVALPEGWKVKELCELVDVLDSKRKPINSKERQRRTGDIPYFGATGQVGTIDMPLFDENLVLLGEDGVQFFDVDKHKAYEISGPSWVNNHAHVLRCRKEEYVQQLLVCYLNQFDYRNYANGTTRLKLTQAAMNRIPVRVPPMREQEKIVEILEEQLSRLDAALASVRAVREKSARFRRSLLNAAFTGALTGHDTSDGTLPPGWERKELEDIAETQLGKMLNSSKQTGSALKPYLRNINLQWRHIDLSDVKEMDIFDNETRQFMLAKGDVLVCEGGEPGRSAVWNLDIEMGFQNAIHRIRPRERLSSEFACYQFEWLVKNGILDELFTGVTIKHFSQQKLRKVEFIVPSLNEQEKIVQILEEQFSRLDASLVIANAIEKKSSAMRRSLLYAAFTGELTREWREGAHV